MKDLAKTEQKEVQELIQRAVDAMKLAYAPYSHFQVGAALETMDGQIITGCNIENGSYGATNCAERTAFFKAVSEGIRGFRRIAIVGGRNGVMSDYAFPCGICRQVMGEFCKGDFQVILARDAEQNDPDGIRKDPVPVEERLQVKVMTLDELLPERFVLVDDFA